MRLRYAATATAERTSATGRGLRGIRGIAEGFGKRLPHGRAARVLLLVTFVDASGRGFFLAGSALFYTKVIGLTTTQVGLGLSMAGLVGLLCAVPIGWIADRMGDGRTLIALQLWRATAFLVYPLVSSFRMFLVVACFVSVAELAVNPVIQSLAGSAAQRDSLVTAMAKVAVARNSAYALSALIATVVITWGSPSAYVGFVLANALAFVVSAVLLTRLRLSHGRPRAQQEPAGGDRTLPFRNIPFLVLSLANGILFLHLPVLSVAFPLWIVTHTKAPDALVGAALVVNTVLAMTAQVRLSRGGDDITCAGNKQRAAGLALAACCALTAATGSPGALVAGLLLLLAIVALTFGELWQLAGAWGLSYGLAPTARRTYYLSVYQLGGTGVTVAGPAVLAVAVVDTGAVGWLGLAAVFVLTGLVVPPMVRKAERGFSRHAPPDRFPAAPPPEPSPAARASTAGAGRQRAGAGHSH